MKTNHQKGYSLIEMVIYIATFAVFAIVIINSLIIVMGAFNRSRSNRDLLESGNFAFERISREIKLAESIDTGNSTLDTSPGTLVLDTTDADDDSREVSFVMSDEDLNLYEDGVLVGDLLGDNVSVTNLVFRQISTSAGSAVRIEMTLESLRNNKSHNFYDTIILRGDY
jgi:type II secretory pathway component PulJ